MVFRPFNLLDFRLRERNLITLRRAFKSKLQINAMEDNTSPSNWVPAESVNSCNSNERDTMLYEGNLKEVLRAANGCIAVKEPVPKKQKVATGQSPMPKGKGTGKKTKMKSN